MLRSLLIRGLERGRAGRYGLIPDAILQNDTLYGLLLMVRPDIALALGRVAPTPSDREPPSARLDDGLVDARSGDAPLGGHQDR
jgi:hypothetical protein